MTVRDPRPRPSGSRFLVRLGTGLAELAGALPEIALLDRCARAGVPVPRGAVLLDGAGDRSADPVALLGPLRSGRRVLVRGPLLRGREVRTDDRAGLDAALRAAWTLPRGSAGRRDVVVLEARPAVYGGSAWLSEEYEDDLVEVREVTDQGRDRDVEPRRVLVARLRAGERAPAGTPPWAARLARLARAVRRALGPGDWQLDWADDGSSCWLRRVREVAGPRRSEDLALIDGPLALPGPFGAALLDEAGARLVARARRWVPDLPADRPLVRVVGERAYLNVSLIDETLRRLGLPVRARPDGDTGPVLGRLFRSTGRLVRTAGARRGSEPDKTTRSGDGVAGAVGAARATMAVLLSGLVESVARSRHRITPGTRRAVASLRITLLRRARRAVDDGLLPHPGALWSLLPAEAGALDDGLAPDPAVLERRSEQWLASARRAPDWLLAAPRPLPRRHVRKGHHRRQPGKVRILRIR